MSCATYTEWPSRPINHGAGAATVEKFPTNLPNDLDTGQVVVDGKVLINMLPLPAKLQGQIEIALLTTAR